MFVSLDAIILSKVPRGTLVVTVTVNAEESGEWVDDLFEAKEANVALCSTFPLVTDLRVSWDCFEVAPRAEKETAQESIGQTLTVKVIGPSYLEVLARK